MDTVDESTQVKKLKRAATGASKRRAHAFGNSVKSMDMFGRGTGFKIKGQDTFTTWVGAFISLFIYGLTLAYAAYKSISLVSRDQASIVTFDQHGQLDDTFEFGQQDEFQVAFGLADIYLENDLYDPEYFDFNVQLASWDLTDDGYQYTYTDLEVRECTKEDFEHFYSTTRKSEVYKKAVRWQCIEQGDWKVHGNWNSQNASLLRSTLTSCN